MSENLTESEKKLDLQNRRKSMNSRKTLLPLFIYMILCNESSETHRLTGEYLRNRLIQSPYNLEVERKALARTLNLLADSDLGIIEPEKKGGGYYCSERMIAMPYDDQDDIDDSYDIYDEEDMTELYDGALEMLREKEIGEPFLSIHIQRTFGVRYDISQEICRKLVKDGCLKQRSLYGSGASQYLVNKK